MPESLPPDVEALRERLEAFLREEVEPLEGELDSDPESPVPAQLARTVRDRSRGAGMWGLAQPRELGGGGAGPLTLTVAHETLAASNLRLARYVVGPHPGVLALAEGKLREDYLEPVLRGEKRSAFAFTEPRDAPRPTEARREGGELVLDGAKAYVTGGAEADFYLVVARTAEGSALVAVDRDAPGVRITRTFHSLDGSHHVALAFDGARVGSDHVLGRVGEGMPRALRDIGRARLQVAARACGMCLWILERTTRRLGETHRGGKPLGEREGVRLRYADLRIETFAARSVLYRTARLAERGDNVVSEVMTAKVLSTEVLARVVDGAIQLEGGQALVKGHPLEMLYRRARALRLAEGASDVLRLHIARDRLERAP